MGLCVLSGADGSGKTTTARLLAAYLGKRGSACVHWFRGTHLLASLLARLLSRFSAFRGPCNPYYRVCVPRRLKPLWIHLEFWSLLPHTLARSLLGLACRFLVCDRGFLDFLVWVVVTLGEPGFLRSIYGRFLARLALRERPVYLFADAGTLAARSGAPLPFLLRELAVYGVLAKYLSPCRVDTGALKPAAVAARALRCAGLR